MANKFNETIPRKMNSKIIGIQFSILSPDEIRKGSVAEITSRDTYINNKPVIGGLFDPRMGVLEPGLICPTDGLDYMQTPLPKTKPKQRPKVAHCYNLRSTGPPK